LRNCAVKTGCFTDIRQTSLLHVANTTAQRSAAHKTLYSTNSSHFVDWIIPGFTEVWTQRDLSCTGRCTL